MTLSLNFCLKSYFVAFKFRFISNVAFRITHFEKRALVCKLFGKHVVIRYFEPVKDSTPNVCKRTISAVLKHASAGVLVISETKTKKVAEDNLQSISTKYSKNLRNQELSIQRKTRFSSFLTIVCMEIDRLLDIFPRNFYSLMKTALSIGP